MVVHIFRPDGRVDRPPVGLAPGRSDLAGVRIGVLDNLKPNAGLLMVTVAEQLAARFGGPAPIVATKTAARPAPEEVMEQVRLADVVLTGSAD